MDRIHTPPSNVSNPHEVPLLLDSRGAGELLGLHYKTVERLAHSGQLPGVKLGKAWRFSRDSLIRFCGGHGQISGIES
jgi:excisionase family DNA binding protein